MKEKDSKPIIFVCVYPIYMALFLMIFSIIFIINFIDMRDNFTSRLIQDNSELIPTSFFLKFISNEITPLKNVSKDESEPSFTAVLFSTMTDIWLEDHRTFIGRELPGFSSFNTEIAVAGKGTNLTNLPIESAPPLEVLKKEQELTENETPSVKEGVPPTF
jgi:stage II sporulation protein P